MPPAPVRHPLFARFYARLGARMETAGVGEHRDKLLAGLTGSVLEAGAGSGLNFAHYPLTVTRVLAVEPEPHLRELAERAARRGRGGDYGRRRHSRASVRRTTAVSTPSWPA